VKKVAAFVAVTFLLGAAASPQTGHPPSSPSGTLRRAMAVGTLRASAIDREMTAGDLEME